MQRLVALRRFAPVFRAFGAAGFIVVSLLAALPAPAEAAEEGRQRLTPEQRREMWTPEERQAMRQRFRERQQDGRQPGNEQAVPPRRQLSPEERQQLRAQIEQAQRDVYRRGNAGNKGANK